MHDISSETDLNSGYPKSLEFVCAWLIFAASTLVRDEDEVILKKIISNDYEQIY